MGKYTAYTEGYKTEVAIQEEREVKGFPSYYVVHKNDTEFQNQKIKCTSENLAIHINEKYIADIQMMYETNYASQYAPLFDQLLESLSLETDERTIDKAMAADEAAADEAYKKSLAYQEEKRKAEENAKYDHYKFSPPQQGGSRAKIGDFDFEVLADKNRWHISHHQLGLTLCIKTNQIEEAIAQELLDDYNGEEGEIKFYFQCAGIYQNGVPTGQFKLEKSKQQQPYLSLDHRNTFRSLKFNGYVYFQDGWAGIVGEFYNEFNVNKPTFKVVVYHKMNPRDLDWSQYRFNIDEALQAPVDQVKYLSSRWTKKEFPKELLQFTNLRELHLFGNPYNSYPTKKSPLEEIHSEIDVLQKLESLNIFATFIETVPESIGHIKSLKRLLLDENEIRTLPESLFQLPHLDYVSLRSNHLESLPEKVDLPALKDLDIRDNQLKTLPESWANLPQLKRIEMQGNSWESLPLAFEKLNLKIDMADKLKLFPNEYMGADEKGVIPWDDSVYYAKNDPEQLRLLQESIQGTVLEKYQKALEKLALKSVCISVTDPDDYSNVGNTRYGGLPDLPKGEKYPAFTIKWNEESTYDYQFIAQLNCTELALYQDYLPRTGILYFYLQDQESFKCKVVYQENETDLQSAKNIDTSALNIFDDGGIFNPYHAKAQPMVALPSTFQKGYWNEWASAPELEELDWDGEVAGEYDSINDEVRIKLGKSSFRENNPDWHHSINDYVFTQHEGPRVQAAQKFKGKPEDYVVLLKVSSDVNWNCGFCFWDAGELFFVIHKSDLAKRDFSQVYANIETS